MKKLKLKLCEVGSTASFDYPAGSQGWNSLDMA